MDQCAHCSKSNPSACKQDCGGCSGCCGGGSLTISLTSRQAQVLMLFAQVPHLPLCRTRDGGETEVPLFLPDEPSISPEAAAESLLALAAKGLVSLDYTLPLKGCDYAEYNALRPSALPLERGSVALTPLGQAVLEQVELL